ncbi:heme NO-binding domain-containing protein [Natronobacterium texcoconense]|uniref:Haem-NO-binding n=1 Tax=Natronobacterium texcoconense TaxID=1095778 RepID=A0A1H1I3Y6_NATTX|nr:heme NO-binding domain-containing protein [Natronobacterium texcoconense]SDR32414.1 Haem-NO-binding [Natronobacterium texcoconense]
MHGIVPKTLEEYVVEHTDETAWDAVLERAAVETTLYLPVSRYDDRELEALLTALSNSAAQSREGIERDFGRRLAPALLATFDAHVADDRELHTVLLELEAIAADIESGIDGVSLPEVSGRVADEGNTVVVTYRSQREYCSLAHGVLEGFVSEFDAGAVVEKIDCVHEDADACRFRVALE